MNGVIQGVKVHYGVHVFVIVCQLQISVIKHFSDFHKSHKLNTSKLQNNNELQK